MTICVEKLIVFYTIDVRLRVKTRDKMSYDDKARTNYAVTLECDREVADKKYYELLLQNYIKYRNEKI